VRTKNKVLSNIIVFHFLRNGPT